MKTVQLLLLSICSCFVAVSAQDYDQYKVHSHNDYRQKVPFWTAYVSGASSIEADVFLKNGVLFVTHAKDEIVEKATLESLYLEPLKQVFSEDLGNPQEIQLLIDIKSDADKTLNKLVQVLNGYPELTHNPKIKFVISGNRPQPEAYKNYPDFIWFDHQHLDPISKEAWQKVALISLSFRNFSVWNGKGRMVADELQKVKEVIKTAHSYNKPFRFWATPDSKSAWEAMQRLGVDYINTDRPFQCVEYVSGLKNRTYTNSTFSEVYQPTFVSDGSNEKVDNVILMIGDGNGLSQISSAVIANGGKLTLTQLKKIGLIKTQSTDDLTTDSAAAGTAMATGRKTNNRYIGVDSLGNSIQNLTELLAKHQIHSGIITTDEITGATPSAFYAHQKDRGNTDGIVKDLSASKLSFFAGGGKAHFETSEIENTFEIADQTASIANNKNERVGYFMAERGVPSVLKGRKDQLATLTKNALDFLTNKTEPFFLLIEAAQIDSFGHQNNTAGIISEMIDFDRAITEAIQYADTHLNTLVIVTADHETSGFGIPHGNMEEHRVEGDFLTDDHTAAMVPVFAYGPQSDLFTGVYENNEIFFKILQALQVD